MLPVVGDLRGSYVLKLLGQELRQVMLLRRAGRCSGGLVGLGVDLHVLQKIIDCL